MPRPKGLRHKWQAGSRSSCQRPGCKWSRDRGYVPARYFNTDPTHPRHFGGGTTEAPVCEGTLPGVKAETGLCEACESNDNYRFAFGCSGPCKNKVCADDGSNVCKEHGFPMPCKNREVPK